MGASAGVTNYGTILKKGSGTPLTYTTIGEQVKVKLPKTTADEAEVTNHESPSGYREFISAKIFDPGEVTVLLNYVKADVTAIRTDFEAGTLGDYQLAYGGETATFKAFVKIMDNQEADSQSGKAATCEVVFRISGKPTFA